MRLSVFAAVCISILPSLAVAQQGSLVAVDQVLLQNMVRSAVAQQVAETMRNYPVINQASINDQNARILRTVEEQNRLQREVNGAIEQVRKTSQETINQINSAGETNIARLRAGGDAALLASTAAMTDIRNTTLSEMRASQQLTAKMAQDAESTNRSTVTFLESSKSSLTASLKLSLESALTEIGTRSQAERDAILRTAEKGKGDLKGIHIALANDLRNFVTERLESADRFIGQTASQKLTEVSERSESAMRSIKEAENRANQVKGQIDAAAQAIAQSSQVQQDQIRTLASDQSVALQKTRAEQEARIKAATDQAVTALEVIARDQSASLGATATDGKKRLEEVAIQTSGQIGQARENTVKAVETLVATTLKSSVESEVEVATKDYVAQVEGAYKTISGMNETIARMQESLLKLNNTVEKLRQENDQLRKDISSR